tara:strand:+ start:223 stop:735 length:513 start_codon:yes stop_codon:yes gene_type:complete
MDKEELDNVAISHAGGIKLGFMCLANLIGIIGLVWIESGWEWIISSYMVIFNILYAVEILFPSGEFSMKRQFIKINIGAFLGLYWFSKIEFFSKIFGYNEFSNKIFGNESYNYEISVILLIFLNLAGVSAVYFLWQSVKIGQYCFIQLPQIFSRDNPFKMVLSKILPSQN